MPSSLPSTISICTVVYCVYLSVFGVSPRPTGANTLPPFGGQFSPPRWAALSPGTSFACCSQGPPQVSGWVTTEEKEFLRCRLISRSFCICRAPVVYIAFFCRLIRSPLSPSHSPHRFFLSLTLFFTRPPSHLPLSEGRHRHSVDAPRLPARCDQVRPHHRQEALRLNRPTRPTFLSMWLWMDAAGWLGGWMDGWMGRDGMR